MIETFQVKLILVFLIKINNLKNNCSKNKVNFEQKWSYCLSVWLRIFFRYFVIIWFEMALLLLYYYYFLGVRLGSVLQYVCNALFIILYIDICCYKDFARAENVSY